MNWRLTVITALCGWALCFAGFTPLVAADLSENAAQAKAARELLEPWVEKNAQPLQRYLHIVCFTPKDREFPADHQARMTRMLQHIQAFYAAQMERNGFGPKSFGLQLDQNGQVVIHEVRGAKPFAEYEKKSGDEIRKECLPLLQKAGINASQETIAIFCNLATWDEKKLTFEHKSPYYAGGTYRSGTAWQLDSPELDTLNLTKKEPMLRDGEYGRISLGRHNSIFIGGMAHELGHAFGLPHCTARPDEAVLGSALMGSGNRTYFEEERGEGRGSFLTFAHALRLASHPLFCGRQEPQQFKTNLTLKNLRIRSEDQSIVVEGVIQGEPPVYGVVAYFDPEGNSDYNATSATAIPTRDGTFKLSSKALTPGQWGTLRLVALHANGATSSQHAQGEMEYSYFVTKAGVPELKAIQTRQVLGPFLAAINSGNMKLAKQEKDKLKVRDAQTIANVLFNTTPPSQTPAEETGKRKESSLTSYRADSAKVGWMQPAFNRLPNASILLECRGEIFAKGIYAHAPAEHVYSLGKKWKQLAGKVGLATGSGGSVIFEIRGDGKTLWKSPLVKADQIVPFQVDVSDVTQLQLVTSPSEDGTYQDWGLWLDPVLSR